MDSCVHVWRLTVPPEATGAVAAVDEEYSCGGYAAKVNALEFNAAGVSLASIGGTQGTVWDFSSAEGPAGTVPVVLLGHTKNAAAQAWQASSSASTRQLLATAGRDGRVLVYDVDVYAEPDEEGMPKFCAPVAVAPQPASDEASHLLWPRSGVLYVAYDSGELIKWELPELENNNVVDEPGG
jgi:WD40 repeat protein